MDRNELIPALSVDTLEVNLAWGSLDVFITEDDQFRVQIAGDENSCDNVRVEIEKGCLLVEQPALGLTYRINQPMWLQVSIMIPASWKGTVDLSTVSGHLTVEGVSGSDIKLESVSGNIRAGSLRGIAVKLVTVSGDIDVTAVDSDTCTLHTVSGNFRLGGGAASVWKLMAASGDMSLALVEPPEKISGSSVSGKVWISVPMDEINAKIRTVCGRIITNRIVLSETGPKVTFSTVSGDLELNGNA